MSKKKKLPSAPEWSHLVDVQDLGRGPLRVTLAPGEAEKKGLLQRLGLQALETLEADVTLERGQGATIHVHGTIRARVTQSCVVTLEPVVTDVAEDFDAWYVNPEEAVTLARVRRDKDITKGQAEAPMLDEQEDPEHTVDGKIDLGELITQQLSLALDPYPRAEGAEYPSAAEGPGDGGADLRKNPFAALKDWKTRHEKGN